MEFEGPPSVLSTPIRKIRNLTLNSPSTSPLQKLLNKSPQSSVRYPSMSDLPSDPIFSSMVDKGYSQTISNTVLRELDSRANEISTKLAPKPLANKKKRYSGVHRPLFAKMESISAHYAAARTSTGPLPQKDYIGSATKKRRTLNGPEEIFGALGDDNESPVRHREDPYTNDMDIDMEKPTLAPVSHLAPKLTPQLAPKLTPVSKLSPVSKLAPASPFLTNIPQNGSSRLTSSPVRSFSTSPTRPTGISPSKGSMNLNGLLNDDSVFAKPAPSQKMRQSSLQMAGVMPSPQKESSIPVLQRGPSIPSLLSRSSIPSLQRKLSIPSLQKKPSIPTLQKKPSVSALQKPALSLQKPSTLQKKPSVPSLQKKPSIPSLHKPTAPLQKKPSIPTLQSKPSSFKKPAGPLHHASVSSIPNTNSSQSLRSVSSHRALSTTNHGKDSLTYASTPLNLRSHFSSSTLHKKPSNTSLRSNVTIPQPFSLYDKPTLSSSQKSLQSLTSTRTLEDMRSASQRSLNRFQRFKNRFS